MVLVTKNKDIRKEVSKRWLFCTTILGVGLLIIPLALCFINPVFLTVLHNLRVENGSMINELLLRRFINTKMHLYLYNVTNAGQFISGADEKVKLEEIGPFVYQEYRTNEDLEINKDPGIMRYTPKIETVFLPEESVGDPKNINVTAPNIALLACTALISKYPYIVRQIFNMVVASNKLKAFVEISAYDHIWGYADPLIQLGNNVVPGLIYFKSIGVFERLYDFNVDFRLEIGTTDADKFNVKKVTKIQTKNNNTDARALVDNTFVYNETYEGAGFPPHLTPHTPIHIYRHGVCKAFHLQHVGSKQMSYGGNSFVYHFHNDTFRDKKLCNTKGWCPEGLKDLSECYYGFPIALSKSHFLDSDPRLLDMVEGLKPDRKKYDSHILLDPKIGVGIEGSVGMQINLFLADVGFNPETRRLKDIVLPVCNIMGTAPPMIEEVKSALLLLYKQEPYIIGTAQVVCTLLGLLLLAYSAKLMHQIWLTKKDTKRRDVMKTQDPLLIN